MDIIVEKVSAQTHRRTLRDCEMGDVIRIPAAFGVYVYLGGGDKYIWGIHISDFDGNKARPGFTQLGRATDWDTECVLLGHVSKLQWVELEEIKRRAIS